jgi:hypothetical protein
MTSKAMPASADPVASSRSPSITVVCDGESVKGIAGQTIAGVLLGSGRLSWRRTSVSGAARGVFCGIGVCYDCIVTVNGSRDVRACLRRADDGDVITTQHDALPVRS